MPQLSFAELIERDVPLAAGEAVALALAAAAAHDAASDAPRLAPCEDILLSSSGDVTFASRVSKYDEDEAAWLTLVVCRLLRLDEPGDRARCRGRVPGGLLVLVARMRGQIDLPPLSSGALRDSLKRFSAGPEPSLLAAVFWRAARMRSRQSEGMPTPDNVHSRASVERRRRGPSASELRSWLRQTERELFTMRQRRPAVVGALRDAAGDRMVPVIAVTCLIIAAGLWMYGPHRVQEAAGAAENLVILGRPGPSGPARPVMSGDFQPAPATVTPLLVAAASQAGRVREPLSQAKIKRSAMHARTKTAQPPSKPTIKVKTVRLVNLPRASWAVVQETSSVRPALPARPNARVPSSNYLNHGGRRTP